MNFFKKQDLTKEIDTLFLKEDHICRSILDDYESNYLQEF